MSESLDRENKNLENHFDLENCKVVSNKTKVKSVQLEKTFDFEISFLFQPPRGIWLSVLSCCVCKGGVNFMALDKPIYQILASY